MHLLRAVNTTLTFISFGYKQKFISDFSNQECNACAKPSLGGDKESKR